MIEHLQPGKATLHGQQYVPPFLSALIAASAEGHDLLPYVESVTRYLGFENFLYAVSAMPELRQESKAYVFTTMPRAWVARYDQLAYVEVDPRVTISWDSTAPLIWDQTNVRGHGPRCDAFLDDALKHGIASGVCFMLHAAHDGHVLIALNSSIPYNDAVRMPAITRNLPDILMFGHYFHEVFMRSVVSIGAPSASAGAPLSNRERQCLNLAAHGMTTDGIASELEISSRTVQYHFDNIRSKLGAANRQEAVAIAVRSRLVEASRPPP